MSVFPTLSDLAALEKTTLQAISTINEFHKLNGGISRVANDNMRSLQGRMDIHLDFIADLNLRQDAKKTTGARRVDVGMLVEPDNKGGIANASYSVLIARGTKPESSAIVRKMHFDYEPSHSRSAEPKPSVHMQICGKFSKQHLTAGYHHQRLTHWYPAFEKPRIPCAPMSLALVLDWLMLEFQSDRVLRAIRQNSQWRNTVGKAEKLMLAPYFKLGHKFLSTAANPPGSFTQTHLYEQA